MTQGSPTSLASRARRNWEVFAAMTKAAIREERDFTVTGVLKWVLEPLMFTAVYFIFVTAVLQRGQGRPYLLFVLCALLPFRYFSGVAGASLSVVNSHSSILVNRSFPRFVMPLVLLGTEGVSFVISLVFLAPLMAFYGIAPTVNLLWLPVIVAVLALFSSGFVLLLSVFGLYFPDMRGMVQNVVRASFFLSTGLVKVRNVGGDELPQLLQANPLSSIFAAFRDVVMNGRAPAPGTLLYPILVGLVVLGIGSAAFAWREHYFAKEA